MKARIPIFFYPAMTGIVLGSLMGNICFAQQDIGRREKVDGFRGLRWGASVEEASKQYGDFLFRSYEITSRQEEPSKVFIRRDEHNGIDDVLFDAIEYWFKNNRFYRARAIKQSRIGPRTLVTRGEEGFEKLFHLFTQRYGDPMKNNVHYVNDILSVVKDATWNAGKSTIALIYEGPKETNEDRLVLEIRQK